MSNFLFRRWIAKLFIFIIVFIPHLVIPYPCLAGRQALARGAGFVFSFSVYADTAKEKWQERRSTHFIVYYKEAPDEFVKRVTEAAERYYNEIIEDMGFNRYGDFWLWDNRAKIYIYDSQEEYAKMTGQPAWAGGHVYSQGKVIWTYPWAAGFFDTLLPHEMGHIIFREIIGYRRDLPLWLEEGVACYQERSRRWGARSEFKKAIAENRFISFNELNNFSPHQTLDKERVNLFYSEAVSIITFLITEYDKYRFQNFLRNLKGSNKSIDAALNSAYYKFKNLDDLGKEWERYIRQ